MSPLHDLLPRAAGDDVPVGFDHTDVRRRVQRRAHRRQALTVASVLAVVLLGVGVLALASGSDDDREGVYAYDGTGPITRDELISGPWVATAFSAVTTGGTGSLAVSVVFNPDGTLFTSDGDGCGTRAGRWMLDDRQLLVEDLASLVDEQWASEANVPPCPPDTGLLAILADGPTVSRPREMPGTLELRSPRGFVVFERFDRLGAVPAADDLLGAWSDGQAGSWSGESFPFTELTFAADGTLRLDPDPCQDHRSWEVDGELLAIETVKNEAASGSCSFLRITSHDPFNGASRARLQGDGLWLDLEGAVMLLRRVDPNATAETGPHRGRAGESAKDVAERVAAEVLGDPAVTVDVENAGTARVVTMETDSGATLRAQVAYDATADGFRLERLDTPGLSAEETVAENWRGQADVNVLTVTIPEPGRVLVTGYDDAFSSPGKVFIDAGEGVRGTTDPLAIPESAWLHVQLTTDSGQVLHLLAPRP